MFPEFSFPTVTTGMMNRCRVLAFVFMVIGYGWEGAEEGKKRKTRQKRLFCDAGPACMLLLAKLPLVIRPRFHSGFDSDNVHSRSNTSDGTVGNYEPGHSSTVSPVIIRIGSLVNKVFPRD